MENHSQVESGKSPDNSPEKSSEAFSAKNSSQKLNSLVSDVLHKGSKRKRFLQSMHSPDSFLKNLRQLVDSILGNKGVLITFSIVFLVFLFGMGFWMQYRTDQAKKASSALYLARAELEKELKTIDDEINQEARLAAKALAEKAAANKSSPGTKTETTQPQEKNIQFEKFDVNAKLSKSIPLLKAIGEKFSSTRSAQEAWVELGSLYYKHGSSAEDFSLAASYYEKALKASQGAFEKLLASRSYAAALEEKKDHALAVSILTSALSLSDDIYKQLRAGIKTPPTADEEAPFKGEIWLAIARNHELNNDIEKATKTYDEIISKMPNSEAAKTAQARKAK